MNDLIINAVITAGGLVLLGLLALGRRRSFLWFGILLVAAIALSARGAIMPRAWPTLAGDVGLSRPLFLLLLWIAYGALFRALPDHGLRGHPALLAAALAAMVGELVAA
ncbi:MAG: hypothetical protein QGG40_21745, partial [Myxococcota bacterium]|nr:hypothetical protein [Myxococcota bacterium]